MTPARRIRTLASLEEAELEEKRQALLSHEWDRRKDKIKMGAWLASGAFGGFTLKLIADVASAALGP